MLKDIYTGLVNLYRWLPIIWSDRDWDNYYLSKIMVFKMRRMADYHEKYGVSVHHLRKARDLRVAAEHLERSDDTFCFTQTSETLYKHGTEILDKYFVETELDNGCTRWSWEAKDELDEKELAYSKRLTSAGLSMQTRQAKYHLDSFTKVFNKHFKTWWD